MKLDKYYFDGISEDGRVFIAYSAKLSIGKIKIPYSSIIYHFNGKTIEHHHFTKDRVLQNNNAVHWINNKLNINGKWHLKGNPITASFYEDNAGKDYIKWHVLSGLSKAELRLQNKSYHLSGYLEKISVSMPMLKLPIKRLLWGRWINHDRTRYIVWIIWEDEHGNSIENRVWDNGTEYSASSYSMKEIAFENKVLEIEQISAIRTAEVADSVIDKKKILQKFLPKTFKHIMEHKYYAHGRIDNDSGTIIYEEVLWL